MDSGWVKLWRRSVNSKVFQNDQLWKLWTLCLLKANHKERWVDIDGLLEPVKITPGQFITGRFQLHKDYYGNRKINIKSPLTLWRWLEKLENMENLNIKSYTKFTIISINNWEHYQQSEQQANNRRTTDEQQANTNKNVKNVENVKNKDIIPFNEIISYLNEKSGKLFKPTTATTKNHIKARWREKFTLEDFKTVIDGRCSAWGSDPKMCEFIRPQTLFGTKFEAYLQESNNGDKDKYTDDVRNFLADRVKEADRRNAD